MKASLVLASQSPYRRAQLTQFGIHFRAEAPRVNEEELKPRGPKDLSELTRFLATEKAKSLSAEFPEAVILGSDQLVDLEGQRLDKPGSREGAIAQLKLLSGRTHRLITSLALLYKGNLLLFTDITSIELKALSEAQIAAYVDQDQPFDCAGSYKIEKAGMALVKSLQSSDPSAIQGLPLLSLARGLDELGFGITDLWSPK